MNIQIITNGPRDFISRAKLTYTTLNTPNTLDAFDLNIINLQCDTIWKNEYDNKNNINCINDFVSLKKNIENSKKSTTIILLPQNYIFKYNRIYTNNYRINIPLKDMLASLNHILVELLPASVLEVGGYESRTLFDLLYENSETECGNSVFTAAFTFFDKFKKFNILTKCKGAENLTTIQKSNLIITTLDIQGNSKKLDDFLFEIGILRKKEDAPLWVKEYNFFDDTTQNETIKVCQNEIAEMEKKIVIANEILVKNLKYKSMLYESGGNLVRIVYEVLEEILNCDLSLFKDEFKEDFLIKLADVTFVGEIKGINSNVKSENISQLEVHYRGYLDKLQESGLSENVKALLIINPFRNKPLEERAEIHETQVALAKRNESLIITTHTLLLIYERFLRGELTTERIIEIFKNNKGLLGIESI